MAMLVLTLAQSACNVSRRDEHAIVCCCCAHSSAASSSTSCSFSATSSVHPPCHQTAALQRQVTRSFDVCALSLQAYNTPIRFDRLVRMRETSSESFTLAHQHSAALQPDSRTDRGVFSLPPTFPLDLLPLHSPLSSPFSHDTLFPPSPPSEPFSLPVRLSCRVRDRGT